MSMQRRRQAIDTTSTPAPRRFWQEPTRAVATLAGLAGAGFLAWLTTRIDGGTTGGYWAVYGILAGAGLGMAVTQLLGGWTKWGRPRLSRQVFLLAFVPALVAVAWIVVFHQPHSNWFRSHVVSWSGDIGIAGFVTAMGGLLTMLAFGLGLAFGLSFDTASGQVIAAPAAEVADASDGDVEPAASEPLMRDREVVHS